MTTYMKTKIHLPRAIAMFLTMAFVGVAAADMPTPFRGTLQGQETDVLQGNPPEQLAVKGAVSGIASAIGRFTLSYQATVSLPIGSSTGSAQLTAEDGDTLSTTIVGLGPGIPNMPGIVAITEIHTITAGTGHFAGATGSFTVERLVNLADMANVPTSGTFTGNIALMAAAH